MFNIWVDAKLPFKFRLEDHNFGRNEQKNYVAQTGVLLTWRGYNLLLGLLPFCVENDNGDCGASLLPIN